MCLYNYCYRQGGDKSSTLQVYLLLLTELLQLIHSTHLSFDAVPYF